MAVLGLRETYLTCPPGRDRSSLFPGQRLDGWGRRAASLDRLQIPHLRPVAKLRARVLQREPEGRSRAGRARRERAPWR